MDFVWYIIGSVLIAVVVLLTAWISVRLFLDNDRKKRLLELKYDSKSLVTPLRIQAYERLALFLERIDLNQLLLRLNTADLNSEQLKSLLIANIRAEYEHNLSQQIFVSSEVWARIVRTKEETIKLINLSAAKTSTEASGINLATVLLEQIAGKAPNEGAMEMLKEEVRLLF